MAEPAQPVTTGLGAAYWRLWTAQGAANLADGVLKVALPLAAIGYTRSPALVAGVAFAVTVPWLLFALPAGALVDRLDRRRVMIGADAARAALLGVLAVVVVADAGSIRALYVIGVCVGVTETFHDTAAQSLLPQVVRRDQLERANGRLFAVELTANEFVGPPLAGFLVAAGLVAAFATPAGLWALAVGALLLVPGSFRVPRERRTTLRADVAEGVRFLWGNPLLRTFSVMVGVFNFTSNGRHRRPRPVRGRAGIGHGPVPGGVRGPARHHRGRQRGRLRGRQRGRLARRRAHRTGARPHAGPRDLVRGGHHVRRHPGPDRAPGRGGCGVSPS